MPLGIYKRGSFLEYKVKNFEDCKDLGIEKKR